MKYKIGQKVRFKGRVAYVMDVWETGAGLRYYIDTAGLRWSVTEHEIDQNNSIKSGGPFSKTVQAAT